MSSEKDIMKQLKEDDEARRQRREWIKNYKPPRIKVYPGCFEMGKRR